MSDYMNNIREIASRVNIGFYGNSGDDFGEIYINRNGWTYIGNDVSAPSDDIMFERRKQLTSYGTKVGKYAVLDGTSKLDGQSVIADLFTGLVSDVCCDAQQNFTNKKPNIVLFYTMTHNMSQIIITGHKAWVQFPVDYDIVLHYDNIFNGRSLGVESVPEGCEIHRVVGVNNETEKTLTFRVTDGSAVEQAVTFIGANENSIVVGLKSIELIINKWSSGGKCAKITYFSRDINVNLQSDEIESINIVEEKASEVKELSYGITSNSCTVKIKDTGMRFSSNLDLMRKNKLVQPFIALKRYDADGNPVKLSENDYYSLGNFYSDSWEMSSNSAFITCKAYDLLYGLQDIYVDIPYKKNSAGKYEAPRNMSAYDIIECLVKYTNEYKHAREIRGMDIECELDVELKNRIAPIVLFDNSKTVWETLQNVADFAQCYIYANRQGKLVASCDKKTHNVVAEQNGERSQKSYYISPKNSFSYSIPLQSKCIINNVVMPYSYIEKKEKESGKEEEPLTIKKEDLQVTETDQGTVYSAYLELNNINIIFDKLEIYGYINGTSQLLNNQNIVIENTYSNGIYLEFVGIDYKEIKIEFKINNGYEYKISNSELEVGSADKVGIRINGVNEYSAKRSMFMLAESESTAKLLASAAAKRILDKYQKGVTYTETEWIGTPELELSAEIPCSNRYEIDGNGQYVQSKFECMSNEITLEGGLRMKSKLRKIGTG